MATGNRVLGDNGAKMKAGFALGFVSLQGDGVLCTSARTRGRPHEDIARGI